MQRGMRRAVLLGELCLFPSQTPLFRSRWMISEHQPHLSFLLLLLSRNHKRGDSVYVTMWQAVFLMGSFIFFKDHLTV